MPVLKALCTVPKFKGQVWKTLGQALFRDSHQPDPSPPPPGPLLMTVLGCGACVRFAGSGGGCVRAAGSETCSAGRLEWHLGVWCLGGLLGEGCWKPFLFLFLLIGLWVSCGVAGVVSAPTMDKGGSLLTPCSPLHPRCDQWGGRKCLEDWAFHRRELRPLGAAQPALLNLLRAASPPDLCFPRACIYYFNYFTETPPITLCFCTLAVYISLGPFASSIRV